MSNSTRNSKKKLAGDGGYSASVSSQLHIDLTYESHHTKGNPCNSLMKAVAPTFQKWPHPPK